MKQDYSIYQDKKKEWRVRFPKLDMRSSEGYCRRDAAEKMAQISVPKALKEKRFYWGDLMWRGMNALTSGPKYKFPTDQQKKGKRRLLLKSRNGQCLLISNRALNFGEVIKFIELDVKK